MLGRPELRRDQSRHQQDRIDANCSMQDGTLQELQQLNCRQAKIISELLIKNQTLRWALHSKATLDRNNAADS